MCIHAKYLTIYINIQGYSKHSNYLYPTHILLKRIHICMLKVLCQNYICSYSKYFATKSYICTFISLLNLYTCILEIFLLPELICIHVFAKSVHMHIQRIFTTNEITFHAYSSILLLKLHFNSTRFLVRYLFAIYMQHTHILWGILPPILHLYVHDEQHSQTTRQTSWCSPKNQPLA